MIMMPEQDAALAITAETPDMQEEINLVWQYLLPAFKDAPLPADANAQTSLKEKIKSLALQAPVKNNQATSASINEKTFIASSNDMNLQHISFHFSNEQCRVKFQTSASTYTIDFGAGKWKTGETNMPAPAITTGMIANTRVIYPAKIAASYTWKDANTLQLVLRYIETPHTETFTCNFNGNNKLTMDVAKSFDYGKKKITIEAEVKQ
jgi:hypothetical protein